MKYTNTILSLILIVMLMALIRISAIEHSLSQLSQDSALKIESNAALINSNNRLEASIQELRKQIQDFADRVIKR